MLVLLFYKCVMVEPFPQLTWVSASLVDTIGQDKLYYGGRERAVTYLPLSHIAGTVPTQDIINNNVTITFVFR